MKRTVSVALRVARCCTRRDNTGRKSREVWILRVFRTRFLLIFSQSLVAENRFSNLWNSGLLSNWQGMGDIWKQEGVPDAEPECIATISCGFFDTLRVLLHTAFRQTPRE